MLYPDGLPEHVTMTDQKRLISVDVLKGILIVAIVFIHLVISRDIVSTADAADIEGYTVGSESIGSLVIQALYLGLMAFFVFSGYFYRPGRGFVENMRNAHSS